MYSEEFVDPHKHIEKIHEIFENSDPFLLDTLAGATNLLEMAFPGSGSFLMEFIQNSDDAKSDSMEIEITEKAIKICNNGTPFTKSDIDSICMIGKSSKTSTNIGYLGVGFKSVFLISESVHVYSGDYRFKFEKGHWGDHKKNIPWEISPIWIEKTETIQDDKWNTEFILYFSDKFGNDIVQAIESEISPENLTNRVLLFLNNLKSITINNKIKGTVRRIDKLNMQTDESGFEKREDYEIISIQEHEKKEYEKEELENEDYWLVFRKRVEVSEEIRNDPTTPENRKNVTEREVLVSFRLEVKGDDLKTKNLKVEESGTAHAGVFSFLPLKKVKSGLNFLVQADFITTTGRTDIQSDYPWNKWITSEIYNLIIEKCVNVFLLDPKWRLNFTSILYSSGQCYELFEEYLKKPLNYYLKEKSVLVDTNGTCCKPDELIQFSNKEIRDLISEEDFKQMYPKYKEIHPDCKSPFYIKNGPFSIVEFLKLAETSGLLYSKAKSCDIDWFIKIYSSLMEENTLRCFKRSYKSVPKAKEHFDKFWNKMRDFDIPIILINDCNLAKIEDCYINLNDIKIPENLRGNFKIVHPKLAKNEDFKLFIRKLNEERYYHFPLTKVIRELTDEEIESKLGKEKTLDIKKDTWQYLSDEDRLFKIKDIKNYYESSFGSLSSFAYVTLPSKNKEWLYPKDLIFGKDYDPENQLECLEEKEILNPDLKQEIKDLIFGKEQDLENQLEDPEKKGVFNPDFKLRTLLESRTLGPDFLEGIEEYTNEKKRWVDFFEKLGVNKVLNKFDEKGKRRDIVEKISICAAKRYEEINQRSPNVLGSHKKRGYDIESPAEDGSIRYIKVKSLSRPEDGIELTAEEWRCLFENRSKYDVYAITDCLKMPAVNAISGECLFNLYCNFENGVQFEFNKWSSCVKDRRVI